MIEYQHYMSNSQPCVYPVEQQALQIDTNSFNKNITKLRKFQRANILPTSPGMMPFFRKFIVTSPLKKTLLVKFLEPFTPMIGPFPAPKSNSNQPLFTKRRPDIKNPPERRE